jgi:SpoVK/Ycf46/Vps4 family AAA+-type ATPase
MLDGVEPMNGIVTILTTNHLEGIDEALRRPGEAYVVKRLQCEDFH